MSWIGKLVARFLGRDSFSVGDPPRAISANKRDLLVELVAASSYLDFGGTPIEAKLRDNDSAFDRDFRPS